ncbi:GTP-binding protein [Mycoplasmoides fastidiosum]|uniref:Probable GTP-binding protein EngB n=1 Tax=Mycoplasmoides fastidiosum TaxID=92758 RepID=A0ABU0LZU8_9BACT|nr:ribosome biogenesis GTP-binding protein YihA/YsxC [Mycoplasmoides fastidiosum]MDQ0514226.1 GTP-binding protein [Mycoplasmoides fastidiosum]UUD37366.1 ribosome biogenesis GTP-binding protein YihA/YsxC [Mycoplasmoides fastidiosum]
MPKFIIAVEKPEQYPDNHLFECCLVGRSNVGKSSLINGLAKQAIAYISKTPGRTQTVNFYNFDSFWLIDLPGYGYAKVNYDRKQKLTTIIENYVSHRPQLIAVVQVCDINVITEHDVEVKDYLITKFDNYLLALNKMDKLSYSQQQHQLKLIAAKMNLDLNKILLVSARKKTNTEKLLALIKAWTRK